VPERTRATQRRQTPIRIDGERQRREWRVTRTHIFTESEMRGRESRRGGRRQGESEMGEPGAAAGGSRSPESEATTTAAE
jgi:hypothetical protein